MKGAIQIKLYYYYIIIILPMETKMHPHAVNTDGVLETYSTDKTGKLQMTISVRPLTAHEKQTPPPLETL